jgi:hypothetical protein
VVSFKLDEVYYETSPFYGEFHGIINGGDPGIKGYQEFLTSAFYLKGYLGGIRHDNGPYR